MTERDLDKLIALGEGLTLGFKTSASGHLGREICGMANTGDDWFAITFARKPQQASVEDTTQKQATLTTQKTRARILSLMEENPTVTREQLAEAIGITADGIRYHLRKLRQDNLIRRIGPDKGGFWEVLA